MLNGLNSLLCGKLLRRVPGTELTLIKVFLITKVFNPCNPEYIPIYFYFISEETEAYRSEVACRMSH